MTVDHLPQSIADLDETPEHSESSIPAAKPNGSLTGRQDPPAPTPEPAAEKNDSWQQSGFGSFP